MLAKIVKQLNTQILPGAQISPYGIMLSFESFLNSLQAIQIKSNISRFSGFVWRDNEVIITFI